MMTKRPTGEYELIGNTAVLIYTPHRQFYCHHCGLITYKEHTT